MKIEGLGMQGLGLGSWLVQREDPAEEGDDFGAIGESECGDRG